MYQSYDVMDQNPAWPAPVFAVEPRLETHVAGAAPVRLLPATVTGMWSLRFGRFGCPDSETRGGVVFLQRDALMGGDNNFAYRGEWMLDGTELTASLDVVRHGGNDLPTIFGTVEAIYQLDCVAEAITADLFEGRLRRPGHPDARFVMRRVRGGNGGN